MIDLFYLQDLSYHDIHEVSGIPENSIGPTLKRALKNLRRRIENEEGTPTDSVRNPVLKR